MPEGDAGAGTGAGAGTSVDHGTPQTAQTMASTTIFKDLKLNCGPLTSSNLEAWVNCVEAFAYSLDCASALHDINAPKHEQKQVKLLMLNNLSEFNDIAIFRSRADLSAKEIFDKLQELKAAGTTAQKSMLMAKESALQPEPQETMHAYLERASQLHQELGRANLLDESRYTLQFLNSLDNTAIASWAQATQSTESFPKICADMKARFYKLLDQPLLGNGRRSGQPSALNVNQEECGFCGKHGHDEPNCFARRRASQACKDQIASGRGRGRGRDRGRGRSRGRGRGQGGNATSSANTSTFYAAHAHAATKESSDAWIIDSGCTDHMTNDLSALSNISEMTGTCSMANNERVPVTAKGTVHLLDSQGDPFTLSNVLYVPDLHVNLISLSRAHKANVHYSRTKTGMQLKTRHNKIQAVVKDDLFVANCSVQRQQTQTDSSVPAVPPTSDDPPSRSYAQVVQQQNAVQLKHRQLGHTAIISLGKMSANGSVTGLPKAQFFKDELQNQSVCGPCAEGKHKRKPFPANARRSEKKLEKIHVDIGTGMPPSDEGHSNFVVMVDDCSGFIVTSTLKAKSDAPSMLKTTVSKMQKLYDVKVSKLRSDQDTVFTSRDFQTWLDDNFIEFQPTSGYSPQENGHAERSIRTLSEIVQAMLSDSGLNRKYWGHALIHAAYISNITSSDGSLTPWEKLKGEKPDVSNLHIWGCTAWVHVPKALRIKGELPPRARAGKFLGFAHPNMKAYKVLLPNGKIIVSRDVLFDESAPPASNVTRDTFDLVMLPAPPTAVDRQQQPAMPTPAQSPAPSPVPQQSPQLPEVSDSDDEAPVPRWEPPQSRIPTPPPPAQRTSGRPNKGQTKPLPYDTWTKHKENQVDPASSSTNAVSAQPEPAPFWPGGCLLSPLH